MVGGASRLGVPGWSFVPRTPHRAHDTRKKLCGSLTHDNAVAIVEYGRQHGVGSEVAGVGDDEASPAQAQKEKDLRSPAWNMIYVYSSSNIRRHSCQPPNTAACDSNPARSTCTDALGKHGPRPGEDKWC